MGNDKAESSAAQVNCEETEPKEPDRAIKLQKVGDIKSLSIATPLEPFSVWQPLLQARDFMHSTFFGPGSSLPQRVLQMKSWLETSVVTQASINQPPHFLPKRLLDLGFCDRVTAITSPLKVVSLPPSDSARSNAYVTLSHRWGAKQTLRTTGAKLSAYRKGIMFWDLPKTFRDAVTLTRLLRIRYLWVDAICIVQDDPEEWAVEAAAMSDIYGYAILNIAVHTSQCDADGFLSATLEKPSKCYAYETNIQQFKSSVDTSRLSMRAWVFQERLLSPRILHCTRGAFYYEDDGGARAEDGSYTASKGIRGDWKRLKLDREWYQLMEVYSTCSLTYERDRLPAVAGLASRLHGSQGLAYCGGIWAGSIHQGLLWVRLDSFTHHCIGAGADEKPPSWSWAYCGSYIRFLTLDDESYFSTIEFGSFKPVKTASETTSLSKISGNARLELRAGICSMSTISIKHQTLAAFSELPPIADASRVWKLYQNHRNKGSTGMGWVIFDSNHVHTDLSNLWMVQMAQKEPRYNAFKSCRGCIEDGDHILEHEELWKFPASYVMVLAPIEAEHHYRRVGIGRIWSHRLETKMEYRTIFIH